MKILLCFLMSLFLINICVAQRKEKLKGDKELISTSNPIEEEFGVLEIYDNLKVTIAQSKNNSYVLTTDKNLAEVVKLEVNNGVLKLNTTAKITGSKKLEIFLNVKKVSTIILNDDAELETKGTLTSEFFNLTGNQSSKFDLDIDSKNTSIILVKSSAGKIDVKSKEISLNLTDRTDLKGDLDADNLTTQLSKSAKLDLNGKVNNAIFTLKNSADLRAKKMIAGTITLNASNNTDIYAHATKNLIIESEGKSKVYIYGNPNIELKGLTNSSRIIKK